MITYKCNCGKKSGDDVEYTAIEHETEVDAEGVCVYCGYYAIADSGLALKKVRKERIVYEDDFIEYSVGLNGFK